MLPGSVAEDVCGHPLMPSRRWESTVALAALASLKEVPSALMAAEMDIAEACMSPGCDERMVQVLAILARA